MPYKYVESRKPYRSGDFYRRPKRSMGLKAAVTMKRLIRARMRINKQIAMERMKNKYFRYTPKGGLLR